MPFIAESLRRYPDLLSSRLYQMCRERGYRGSADHFRHMVARHRPPRRVEAFLRMTALPGEHGQVDWAHFGTITIGRAVRALLAFVCVLSYSRRAHKAVELFQQRVEKLGGMRASIAVWIPLAVEVIGLVRQFHAQEQKAAYDRFAATVNAYLMKNFEDLPRRDGW